MDGTLKPPPVLTWFKIYCGFMVALYVMTALLFAAGLFINPAELEKGTEGPPVWLFYVIIAVAVLGCLMFAGAFASPFFLSPKPWVWTFNVVLICIGMLSCLTMPASIPLLIYWTKPEAKRYFGRPH